MHSLRQTDSVYRPSGWPQWLLWAAAPLVAALGAVSGILVAVYTAPSPAAAPPPPPAASSQPNPQPTVPVQVSPEPVTIAVPTPEPTRVEPVPTPGPVEQPKVEPSQPGPIRDVRDARVELTRLFSMFESGSIRIGPIEYQQMRNHGLSTSLVGIVPIGNYDQWLKAAREQPQQLKAWLDAAARLALPASRQDRFFLTWATMGVVQTPPGGYSQQEITPLANGTYLVIRPLAATYSPTEPTVLVRALTDGPAGTPGPVGQVREPAAAYGETWSGGGVTAPSQPWATYGPVIRFDGTDLYRPPGLTGTKPKD